MTHSTLALLACLYNIVVATLVSQPILHAALFRWIFFLLGLLLLLLVALALNFSQI